MPRNHKFIPVEGQPKECSLCGGSKRDHDPLVDQTEMRSSTRGQILPQESSDKLLPVPFVQGGPVLTKGKSFFDYENEKFFYQEVCANGDLVWQSELDSSKRFIFVAPDHARMRRSND